MNTKQDQGNGTDTYVRTLLASVFGDEVRKTQLAFTRGGMNLVELVRLHKLVKDNAVRQVLEIGMARATSSIVIMDALRSGGGQGRLTSVDPFQRVPEPEGYAGVGLEHIRKAGLQQFHELIEQPDFTALPILLQEGRQFDFVFVDGWHSFDYTFLDTFYADLLLKDGGILAFHDSSWPGVYKAIGFLEAHKPYQRISPRAMIQLTPLFPRLLRRFGTALKGPRALLEARQRRQEWVSLAAYRKLASIKLAENVPVRF